MTRRKGTTQNIEVLDQTTGELVPLGDVRGTLTRMQKVNEVWDFISKMRGIQEVLTRQKADFERQQKAAEWVFWAVRRMGELFADIETAQGARMDLTSGHTGRKLDEIKKLKLSERTARRYECFARYPLKDAEQYVELRYAETDKKQKLIAVHEIYRIQARKERDERRARAAKAASERSDLAELPVYHGPFVDVAEAQLADASVDFIFTDPPYHDSTLHVYADLGRVASRVLKDGGSLITYTSHHRLPEVIKMLTDGGLTFFWPLAMVHTGPSARMTEYGIVVHWKPLLWFVKGKFRRRGDHMTFVNDLVNSRREKGTHDWQQSVVEAKYYIEALTQPGEFVFDPFCGGGTTAIAAHELKRQWLTCDIDDQTAWLAKARIADAIEALRTGSAP